MTPHHVPLSAIVFDNATQIRALIDQAIVEEYAAAMKAGNRFPEIDVFEATDPKRGTKSYYIGDGWHRCLAYQLNGDVAVPAVIHQGGKIEALTYALSANSEHGLRRTQADKQKAIRVALEQFPSMSNRMIADLCSVAHDTVRLYRNRQVADSATSTPAARTGRDGKSYPTGRPVTAKATKSAPEANPAPAPVPTPKAGSVGEALAAASAPKQTPAAAVIPFPAAPVAPATPPAEDRAAAAATATPVASVSAPVAAAGPAAKFNSADWKAKIAAYLKAALAEVPEQYRIKAADYVCEQAREIAGASE